MLPTLAEIHEAYTKCGLKPTARSFHNVGFTCCCPMTAVYLAETNTKPELLNTCFLANWGERKFGWPDFAGFMCGFDSREKNAVSSQEGYEFGKLVARELGISNEH